MILGVDSFATLSFLESTFRQTSFPVSCGTDFLYPRHFCSQCFCKRFAVAKPSVHYRTCIPCRGYMYGFRWRIFHGANCNFTEEEADNFIFTDFNYVNHYFTDAILISLTSKYHHWIHLWTILFSPFTIDNHRFQKWQFYFHRFRW